MGFRRISQEEMTGKGNLGRPDTPGVSAGEMQRIMDELPREVLAPAFNELAGQLENAAAAASLGAAIPENSGLPEDTPGTVQGVLDAVQAQAGAALAQHAARADNPHGVTAAQAGAYTRAEADAALAQHAARADNPHGVTAAQVGAYTRAETDAAIAQKVVEIGASDMASAVYDPTGRAEDIFAVTDGLAEEMAALEAVQTGLAQDQGMLAQGQGVLAAADAALASEVQIFCCTLLASGWTASGSTYTQTVSCPGLLGIYDLEAPQLPATGVKATDAALKEGLDTLCEAGNSGEALDGQLKWTCYGSRPAVDLPLRLRRAAVKSAPESGGEEA